MNKKRIKQIEKLRKTLTDRMLSKCSKTPFDVCSSRSCNLCRAELLHDLGYRQMPKNAVVLTQKEWAVHNEQFAQAMHQKEVNTRKETALQFAEMVRSEAQQGCSMGIIFYTMSAKELDEIRKKFDIGETK